MEKKKTTKKEYWMFTIITNHNTYVNGYFEEFPTRNEIKKVCHEYNGYSCAILNITKLTKEQYEMLTEGLK